MPAVTPVVPSFEQVRLLVAGDVMLDRYWHGDTTRVSPEAPVPVVRVTDAGDRRAGGAANVAVNVATLGARVRLLGVVGDDEAAGELRLVLDGAGVDHDLVAAPGAGTVTKLRILSRHQQLLRADMEGPAPAAARDALAARFRAALPEADLVVLSDYAKGALDAAPALIAAAREAGLAVMVDPKGGDFRRYRGATVITPNLAEFEAVAGPVPTLGALCDAAARLCRELGLEAMLVTRGGDGMSLVRSEGAPLHVPARAQEVFDVTGAGDTVIATFSAAVAAGCGLGDAARLANLAAGIVVGRLGTAGVDPAALERARHADLPSRRGVVERADLGEALAGARAAGERIVMTNGCFDVLHAGHVAYLEQAKALGDRLLVAVNDDESVRRLKGAGRPVTRLAHRMRVLGALESVDWVVAFSEDTPADLVREVSPHFLVKGGDYRADDVAGGAHVRASGGEVRILPYLEGCSSSDVIAALARVETAGEGGGGRS